MPPGFGLVVWDRFDVLVLSPDASLPEITTLLREAGEKPLDRFTARVEIEDFSDRTELPVAQLSQRFEPDDPRLDPFLQALPELFLGHDGEQSLDLVFLPRVDEVTAISLARRHLELSRILDGHQFRLAGLDMYSPIAFAAMALLVAGFAVAHTSWRRWPVFPAVIPTVVYALAGGPSGAVRAGMVLFVWAIWQDYSRDRELEWLTYGVHPLKKQEFRAASVALLLVVSGSFFMAAGETDGGRLPVMVGFILYLVALGSLSTTAFLIALRRFSRTDHKLFIPVRIYPGNRPHTRREWRQLVARTAVVGAVAAVLLLPLALFFSPREAGSREDGSHDAGSRDAGKLILPVAVSSGSVAEEYSLSPGDPDTAATLLREAQRVSLDASPLSTAGYLAHRRYQESLLYGGSFSVPDHNETVQLVRFARDAGRIRDIPETVITFGDEWIREQLDPPAESAYQLLVDGNRLLVVAPDVAVTVHVSRQRLLYYVILVALGGLPLLFAVRLPYRSRIDTVGRVVKGVCKTA
jgi:hypothetical protein